MEQKSNGGFVCIYRTPSHDQLAIIKSLLEANKISYIIENENFASLGAVDGSINFGVMVQEDLAIEAKALLKEIFYPATPESSESVESENQRKFRGKHPILSVLSGLFGVIVGFIFILLGIILIRVPLSIKGVGEILVKTIFVFLLCVFGFFIISAGHKELKSNLKVINDKKRQPATK